MKKQFLFAAMLAPTLGFTSCGTQNNALGGSLLQTTLGSLLGDGSGSNATTQIATQAGGALIGNLLNQLLSGGEVSEKSIVGTWSYTGSSVVFDSQNFLAQAGGTIASSQIESKVDAQLANFGLKKGVTKFTFKADKTFTVTLGTKKISGTYQLDSSKKTVRLSALGELINLEPYIVNQGTGVALLFKADKVLGLLSTTSSFLGQQSGQLGTLSSILNNFNGMRLGLKLQR